MKYFTDYIFDLVQNSIKAEAKNIIIDLNFNEKLIFRLEDDGMGMEEKVLEMVRKFTYSSQKMRKVGLGLSMIHDLANQTEGYFKIESIKGKKTIIETAFNHHHIDFPDLGDIGVLISDIYINQDVKNVALKVTFARSYMFELKQYIKDKPYGFKTKKEIEKTINQQIDEIKGGL